MPEWLTYESVKDFQTAIVGVIGFLGVVLTLWVNARLNRKQADNKAKLAREQLEREAAEEAKAVAAGFSTVLRMIEDSMRKNAGHPPPDKNGTWLLPKLEYNLYKYAMPQLGKLSPEIASPLLRACLLVDQLNGRVVHFAIREHERSFEIPEEHVKYLRKLLTTVGDELKSAIDALDSVNSPHSAKA